VTPDLLRCREEHGLLTSIPNIFKERLLCRTLTCQGLKRHFQNGAQR
jgi:hypothetical protein